MNIEHFKGFAKPYLVHTGGMYGYYWFKTEAKARAFIQSRKGQLANIMIEQLKAAIQSYHGPMTGNSIEAVWFRGAVHQLLELQAQENTIHLQASINRR